MVQPTRRWISIALCGTVVVLLWAGGAVAVSAPSLEAVPHEVRRPVGKLVGLLRVWDTHRWISVHAVKGEAPLASIQYEAGFVTDTARTRGMVNSLEVAPGDRDGFSGRVVITCALRPDCERGFRVRLRVRDANGATSDWAQVAFPPEDGQEAVATGARAAAPQARVQGDRRSEKVGVVQVDASAGTTMEEARDALERQARGLGGDAVIGLRVVASDADRVTFAADAIRYVEEQPAPAASPTAAPAPGERTTRVLGEIFVRASR